MEIQESIELITNAKKVLTRDNRNLTLLEIETARSVCERIQAMIDRTPDYIGKWNLDPDFANGAAAWGPENFIHKLYSIVAKCDYDVINRLRMYVQIFSGFRLASLENSAGLDLIHPLPADLDEQLAPKITVDSIWVIRSLKMAAMLPPSFIGRAPKMLGEVGLDGFS